MNVYQPKILFIDDDPNMVQGFLDLFGETFSIVTASGGAEALEALEKNPEIAVVVSDQRMPDISGTDLLCRIKSKKPHAVRILITAYADYEAVVDAVNLAEAFYYVKKPYKTEEFRDLIEKAIEKHWELKKRAADEKELQRIIAARAMEVVQNYTSGLAHHIKNPLVAVRSFIEIFSASKNKAQLDEGMQRLLSVADKETGRINELIDLLVKISQCSLSGFQRTRVEKMISLFISPDIQEMLNSKNLRVTMKTGAKLPDLYVDVVSMQDAFQEILKNAIQASDSGKKIEISAEKAEAYGDVAHLAIEIRDEGKGIDAADLGKVFDPFFKRTDDPSVKGLGLTYCQFIVLQHGGSISVESAPGKGTRVTVKLPLIKS